MTALAEHDARGPLAAYRAAEPIAEVVPTRRPSAGEAARTLVHHAPRGALGSLAVEPAGYPFGSVAPYGLLPDGRPVLFISRLAEHTRNLDADPRASLLVTEAHPLGDPMDNGRLTLMGIARRVEDPAERAAAREAYLARNPEAAGYIEFGDFAFWVIDVEAARWVGGFGRMAWCEPADYATAEPDPTAPLAPAAIEHLNDDHAESLLAAARSFTGHPDATAARAVRLDRYGIDLMVTTPRGTAPARAPFDPPVADPDGLRAAAVAMAQRARA